jgi:hypothetical protein
MEKSRAGCYEVYIYLFVRMILFGLLQARQFAPFDKRKISWRLIRAPENPRRSPLSRVKFV